MTKTHFCFVGPIWPGFSSSVPDNIAITVTRLAIVFVGAMPVLCVISHGRGDGNGSGTMFSPSISQVPRKMTFSHSIVLVTHSTWEFGTTTVLGTGRLLGVDGTRSTPSTIQILLCQSYLRSSVSFDGGDAFLESKQSSGAVI
jgi:hypothetical protein